MNQPPSSTHSSPKTYFHHRTNHIALQVRHISPPSPPAPILLLYLPGLLSTFDGRKGGCLESIALHDHSIEYLSLNYQGHGASTGRTLPHTTSIEEWILDIESVLESKHDVDSSSGSKQRIIIVGSSLGAWLALLVAQRRKYANIAALVLLAPAINPFHRWLQLEHPSAHQYIDIPSNYVDGGSIRIQRALVLDARDRWAVGGGNSCPCPVHIMAGELDDVIPVEEIKAFVTATMPHAKVDVVPGGDHRLSTDKDLVHIKDIICSFL